MPLNLKILPSCLCEYTTPVCTPADRGMKANPCFPEKKIKKIIKKNRCFCCPLYNTAETKKNICYFRKGKGLE